MSDIALEVHNLCVDYKSFRSTSIQNNLFKKKEKTDLVHAVSDVSFCVARGEIVGIVGKNGSGKSTMLKAIGGIFKPDKGTIDRRGNTVSLLSIGVGFEMNLSGRENVLLSGMLLGFKERFIREKLEEIIQFSELGEFIDYPVRTYSSGMYSKLAFAITSSLDTDILLVDEVLSVGDEHFRQKSSARMKELISDEQRTVLIVSHDMHTLGELCNRIIWMHDGRCIADGKTETVIEQYRRFMTTGEIERTV